MINKQVQLKSTKQPFVLIKPRESFIELFRWILTAFVFADHTFVFVGGGESWLVPNLSLLVLTAVPLFCLISGFFMVEQPKSRFIKFLTNFFILWCFNIGLTCIVYAAWGWNAHDGLQNLINALECKGVWWYMVTITFVYLFHPVINIIIKQVNKWMSLLFCLFFIIIASLEFNGMTGFSYLWINARQFLWCAGLWMVGSWLKCYGGQLIRGNKKKWCFIIFLVFTLVFLVITNLLYAFDTNLSHERWFGSSDLLVALYAIIIFSVVINIQIKPNKFCNLLGMCSITNYLFCVVGQVVVWSILLPMLNLSSPYAIFLFGVFGLLIFMTAVSLILIWFVDYFCRLLYQGISFLINKIKSRNEK